MVEDKQKMNFCSSFRYRNIFHFETTAIELSSSNFHAKYECYLVEQKPLLLFSAVETF